MFLHNNIFSTDEFVGTLVLTSYISTNLLSCEDDSFFGRMRLGEINYGRTTFIYL